MQGSEARVVRPFFFFLTLVIVAMYIWGIIASPLLSNPWLLILFTLLVLIHLIAHWSIFLFSGRMHPTYFILQGLLAMPIIILSGNIGMGFGLYMALIGEAVGALQGRKRWSIGIIIYNLVLSLLSYVLLAGWDSIRWALFAILPMALFVIIYVSLFNRQTIAREQAQKLASELELANRQLSEYAARVEDLTIANERQRMARELHDTLSQGLAGLILQLEAADAHLTNNRNDKAHVIVADAMVQARTTLSAARRAIDDLRKTSADDLDSALRLEISRFTDATGIPCIFQSDQTLPLADSVQETVIRAVAEGLTNAAHHAQARQVAVNVRMKDKNILVTIQDDGQGFDAATIPAGHYGLLGIQERVLLVNGSFEIQSDNGKGTTLKIKIPL